MKEEFNEQEEAEKLRRLRARIEMMLREANVCGHVVLAGRGGRFEIFTPLDAYWSRVSLADAEDRVGLRIRSMAADYDGDKELQHQQLEWNVGMVSGIGEILGTTAMGWLHAAKLIDERTGAEHTPMRKDDPRDKA